MNLAQFAMSTFGLRIGKANPTNTGVRERGRERVREG
jgi:hypothetical protein